MRGQAYPPSPVLSHTASSRAGSSVCYKGPLRCIRFGRSFVSPFFSWVSVIPVHLYSRQDSLDLVRAELLVDYRPDDIVALHGSLGMVATQTTPRGIKEVEKPLWRDFGPGAGSVHTNSRRKSSPRALIG